MPRKSHSDSEDETSGELPILRDIALVNSANFSDKRVALDKEVEKNGVTRVAILYKYNGNAKNGLVLTCPKDVAFFKCNGVEEETYAGKGTNQRTSTGKSIMKFHLDIEDEDHVVFYDSLVKLCNVVKKKIEKEKGTKKIDVKIRGLYDTIDDDKNVTGHIISARLIESGDGTVYTTAYNDEEQVDVKKIGRCTARPGLIFSYNIPEDEKNYRISVSVAQVYYKKRFVFPLRDAE